MNLEDKLLDILRRSRDYVSGSVLARQLSISRSMVNKLIKSLKSKGFIIESHSRFGYKIIDEDDLSKTNMFLDDLQTKLSFKALYFPYCETSQDLADYVASQGAPEGTLIICESMSKGRGRLGRRWIAPKGGLWFTLVLRPPKLKSLHLLSLSTGLAVAKAIESVANVDAHLKWPNDVLVNNKKVSGILIEAKAEADMIKHVLVGIGINVNNIIPQYLSNIAISLIDITKERIPRVTLLRSVLMHFDAYYSLLLKGETDKIVNEWIRKSLTIGKYVAVKLIDGLIIKGLAIGLDNEGRLLVRDDNNVIHSIDSGDVTHLM